MKTDSGDKKRILILGNSKLVVFGFRGELIKRLVSDGYKVTVSFPNGPFGNGEEISRQNGCKFIETKIDRRRTNPFKDALLLLKYIAIIRREKPDFVLAYTVKCDVYGGIACRIMHTAFLANITGIGKGLAERGFIQKILILLYRSSLKKARVVFFQNEQDQKMFSDTGIYDSYSILLPGSGVNLNRFKTLEYPSGEVIKFLFIGRLMKAKGIVEFLTAAAELKKLYGNVEFHICGHCEEEFESIIQDEQTKGNVLYHGLVDNVSDYIKLCHCVVLPSFHPEGVSNVLLEAAACARPIITSNRAGCRETVDNGITGLLVREQDSEDLIEKMKIFMEMPNDKRKIMGQKGRAKMEKEFDREIVVEAYMKELERQ